MMRLYPLMMKAVRRAVERSQEDGQGARGPRDPPLRADELAR